MRWWRKVVGAPSWRMITTRGIIIVEDEREESGWFRGPSQHATAFMVGTRLTWAVYDGTGRWLILGVFLFINLPPSLTFFLCSKSFTIESYDCWFKAIKLHLWNRKWANNIGTGPLIYTISLFYTRVI